MTPLQYRNWHYRFRPERREQPGQLPSGGYQKLVLGSLAGGPRHWRSYSNWHQTPCVAIDLRKQHSRRPWEYIELTLDLTSLGKVAGIAGIATGAVVILVRPLIEQVLPGLDPTARAETVQLIAIGAFALGGLGILTWAITFLVIGSATGPSVRTRGRRSPGVIAGGNVFFGDLAKVDPTAPGTKGQPHRLPANGRVATRGDQSPGVIGGGDVSGLRGADDP